MIWAKTILIALALLMPGRVWACSLPVGQHVASNFELVQEADLIVVGTVEQVDTVAPDQGPSEVLKVLEVHPVRVLKGNLPEAALTVSGWIYNQGRNGRVTGRPSYTDLDEVNGHALAGGCRRFQFAPDTLVVLFFKENDGILRHFAPTFSRAAEDVRDARNSAWVRAIEHYVPVAALSGDVRLASLEDLRTDMLASDELFAEQIAEDIDKSLPLLRELRHERVERALATTN